MLDKLLSKLLNRPRNKVFYHLLGLITFFSCSLAQSQEQTQSTYTLCQNGAVVRTIRVHLAEKSCRVIYTKEGTDQTVGRSVNSAVCFEVASKIVTNLKAGNWKCKDISQSRISSSAEK